MLQNAMRGNYLVKYLLCIMFFSYRSNFSLFHRPGLSRPTTFCSTAKKLIFSCIYINRSYLIRDLIQLLLIFTLSDYRPSLLLALSVSLSVSVCLINLRLTSFVFEDDTFWEWILTSEFLLNLSLFYFILSSCCSNSILQFLP